MSWYQVKVRYRKAQNHENEDITEQYLTEALSFTEAEQRTLDHVKPYLIEETSVDVVAIAKKPYNDIITDTPDDTLAEELFKCKVSICTLNEHNGKEKKVASYYLVQAKTSGEAQEKIDAYMLNTSYDYEIEQVCITDICEVLFRL